MKAKQFALRASDIAHVVGAERLAANGLKDLLRFSEAESMLRSAVALADSHAIGVERVALRNALSWLIYFELVTQGKELAPAITSFEETLILVRSVPYSAYFLEAQIGLISCELKSGEAGRAGAMLMKMEHLFSDWFQPTSRATLR